METTIEELTEQRAWEVIHGIEAQVRQVVIGQDDLIRKLLIGLFGRIAYSFKKAEGEMSRLRPPPARGSARARQDAAGLGDRQHVSRQVSAHPVHAGHAAGRHRRDARSSTRAPREFRIEKGPIFANIILADEINRAPPKTQSALLEAMQERQVTIGEHTFPLEDPFWVLATQNPVEQEGVFALPEAQLDRFAMMLRVQLSVGRRRGADASRRSSRMLRIAPVADLQTVVRIRQLAGQVHVDEKIHQYIVAIGQTTRATHADALPIVKEMLQCTGSRRGRTTTCWRCLERRRSCAGAARLACRRQVHRARCAAPPARADDSRRSRGRDDRRGRGGSAAPDPDSLRTWTRCCRRNSQKNSVTSN